MEVREYTPEDYQTVAKWWASNHDEPFIDSRFLPKKGLIVEGIGAYFMYNEGNSYLLQYPVFSIDACRREVVKALISMINILCASVKSASIVSAYPQMNSIRKALERCGFVMLSEYNREMVKGVR